MNTIPVIFVGHGGYPDGVRDAVRMILGRQDRVAVVSLAPADTTEDVADRVSTAIEGLGGTGHTALVLADLMGGGPANAAGLLALRHPDLHVVAGLNLPMALEVLTSTASGVAELAAVAEGAGRDGVIDVAARLRAAAGAGA
jgi:PTS system mannose-specific IIA component